MFISLYTYIAADSITMENPDDLDLCVILWTVSAYVIADLVDKLPRTEIYGEVTDGTPQVCGPHPIMIITLLCMILFRRFA
jgi:hypothetical protein